MGRVVCGHVLDVLEGLKDECVHMVVTSPPYWGLRDYGLPPVVWNEGAEDCPHVWGEDIHGLATDNTKHKGQLPPKPEKGDGFRYSAAYVNQPAFKAGGQFCSLCNAWRGSLGLEPTPDCGRPLMELRDDLTEKEQRYVFSELGRLGLVDEGLTEDGGHE